MKQAAFARLARIEAHSAKALAGQHGGSEYKLKTALLAIVATHIGKLGGNDSCAEGIARALGVTPPELARALSNDRDGLWDKVMRALDWCRQRSRKVFQTRSPLIRSTQQ